MTLNNDLFFSTSILESHAEMNPGNVLPIFKDGRADVDDEAELSDGSSKDEAGEAARAGSKRKRPGGKGRRKIPIEYISDKGKRAITFSKRKAGIFTKASELSKLTGSNLLLLVVSESGVVYTYTTEKFEPLVSQSAGRNMIAACLNGTISLANDPSASLTMNAPKQPRRGGQIMLKGAFGGGSIPDKARQNTKERHSNHDADHSADSPDPPAVSPGLNQLGSTSQSTSGSSLPPLPKPPSHDDQKREQYSKEHPVHLDPNLSGFGDASSFSRLPPHDIPIQQSTTTDGDGSDAPLDLDDDGCLDRLRGVRRSLSIERQFEQRVASSGEVPLQTGMSYERHTSASTTPSIDLHATFPFDFSTSGRSSFFAQSSQSASGSRTPTTGDIPILPEIPTSIASTSSRLDERQSTRTTSQDRGSTIRRGGGSNGADTDASHMPNLNDIHPRVSYTQSADAWSSFNSNKSSLFTTAKTSNDKRPSL